jgi:hypothetical protein
VGRGSRVYDVAGLLVTAAGSGQATLAAEARLLDYAVDVAGPRAFALCAASTVLTMADAFLSLGRAAQAPAAAPGMEHLLARCAEAGR